MDLKELVCEGKEWIHVASSAFRFHKMRKIPDQLSDYICLKKDCFIELQSYTSW
jgi:hypothetical protein